MVAGQAQGTPARAAKVGLIAGYGGAKLGIRVSKRTIQKYMRGVRTNHGGQSWATFLANHADSAWACDFIQTYDILFRQVYAFFIVHLGSRKVIYLATE